MILSDKTLMKMLDEHTLIVDPLEIGQIQPASIDIRIGNTYSIVEDSSSGIINLDDEISYKQITAENIYCFRDNLYWQQQWNISNCLIISQHLLKDAVL